MTTADIRRLINDFRWVHSILGLIGNLTFFIGSIFFFWEITKAAGIWLFVIGAFGMLIGSAGEIVVKYERRELGI